MKREGGNERESEGGGRERERETYFTCANAMSHALYNNKK
jgi:hypothetical protein